MKQAEAEGNKAALTSFTFAMKAEELQLYQEALDNLDSEEEGVLLSVPGVRKYREGRAG